MWHHPKYYKELRKRNKSDQVISANKLDGDMKVRAPGPGLKLQATQATSCKLQAPSNKRQAASHKLQAPRFENHEKVSRTLNRGALL